MQAAAGSNGWWIAPTYSVAGIAYRRACNWLRTGGFPKGAFTVHDSTQSITMGNGCRIWFKGAENYDSLYGEDVFFAVIDEGSRVSESAWYAIRSTLTATQGRVKIIGNVLEAGYKATWMHKLARMAQVGAKDYAYFRLTAYDAAEAGVLSLDEIEDAKKTLPDHVFRALYLAEVTEDRGLFFSADAIKRTREQACRPPVSRGELVFSVDTVSEGRHYRVADPVYHEGHTHNRLKLWVDLENGRPRQDRNYVAFADLSQGVGASNSTLEIACTDTREQVAAFTTSELTPEVFAQYCVAICKWFGGQIGYTLLGWEANGPGQVFGREVVRCGHIGLLGNRELRRAVDLHDAKLGWWSTRDAKAVLLSDLRRAMVLGEYTPRESEMLDEAEQYIYYPSGAIGPAELVEDTEGARKTHGDRVIRSGGIVMMFREAPKAIPAEKPIPAMSYAGRQAELSREREALGKW
jgi:hypothetical protein